MLNMGCMRGHYPFTVWTSRVRVSVGVVDLDYVLQAD